MTKSKRREEDDGEKNVILIRSLLLGSPSTLANLRVLDNRIDRAETTMHTGISPVFLEVHTYVLKNDLRKRIVQIGIQFLLFKIIFGVY